MVAPITGAEMYEHDESECAGLLPGHAGAATPDFEADLKYLRHIKLVRCVLASFLQEIYDIGAVHPPI